MSDRDDAMLDWLDRADKRVDEFDPKPKLFSNFGESSLKGGARGVTRAAFLARAGSAIIGDRLRGDGNELGDTVFGEMESAVDALTPDPATTGTASQISGGLLEYLAPLALSGGNPAVAAAGTAGVAFTGPTTDLIRQGVDTKTAAGVGGIYAGATLIGFRIPFAGATLPTRVASGVAGNVAVDVPAEFGASGLLKGQGYEDQAQAYGPTWESTALAALMGAGFGGYSHYANGRAVTQADQDAILTANNANHFANESMPGTPRTPEAATRHQTDLATAIKQILDGEPVNVQGDLSGFDLRPELRPAPRPVSETFDRAVDDVLRTEGGYVNDPADRGGETNFGISARANPDVDVANLTRDQAKEIYRQRYWEPIGADTLPEDVRHIAFDSAVNHGVGWTRRALAEAGNDPARLLELREAHYRGIVAGDPSQAKFLRGWLNRIGRFNETTDAGRALRERLIADPAKIEAEYAARPESDGGVILNTDTARELAPEYLADRTRSADVHEAASDIVKTIYDIRLARPTPEGFDPVVRFSAGGTGAGKTTGLRSLGSDVRPEIVYDTNMNTLRSAIEKVEQAIASGREVEIVYTYRDPVESLTGGALPRAMRQEAEFGSGRTVPLGEHGKTHLGVRPVMEELARMFADDPRVRVLAVDNSRGKGQAVPAALEKLPRLEENRVREELTRALEAEYAAGRISEAVYRGFAQGSVLGEARLQEPRGIQPGVRAGDRGQPQPERPVDGQARPDPSTEGRPAAGSAEAGRGAATAATGKELDPARFPVQGADTTVVTERGLQVQVRYAVTDVAALVTSHDDALNVNPEFPADLQPRDRARAASAQQITRIANNLNPALLAESPKAADGAPIVGQDAVVESGNARTIAVRRAYATGKADAYRQFLVDEAERFGLDPAAIAGVEQPMLVRVALDDARDRAEFARQANEQTVAGMSATEQALADARNLPDMASLVTNDDGTINMRASGRFVQGFIEQAVGPNERATMATAAGDLSQQGQTRIRSAVFARAYGDPDLVAMMAEATDANVKNVLAGMLRAAPNIARLREMIAEGGRYGPDLAPDLVMAVRKFSQLRSEGTTVEAYEAQGSFFGDTDLTPKARDLLRTVSENARAPKRMAEFLQRYVDAVDALGDPRQADVFAAAKDGDSAVTRAAEATREANEPSTMRPGADMFGVGRRPAAAEQPSTGTDVAVKRGPLSVRMGGQEHPVASFEDASAKFIELRESVGDIGGMRVVELIDESGNAVGFINHNGTVRAGDYRDQRAWDAAPVYEPPRTAPRYGEDVLEGSAERVQPAITPETRAAYEAIAAMPDLQVMGEDGVMRRADEFLAEGKADQAKAAEDVRAIAAAADCFTRTAA